MTAVEFLRNRGGYYALHEIAKAIGKPKPDTRAELDAATQKGITEHREYHAGQIQTGPKGGHRVGPTRVVEQWRVVK